MPTRRRYRHTARLSQRLITQLYRVLIWARNHKHRVDFKDEAMEKAKKILEDRGDELISYTFRTRVKPQLGDDVRDLTQQQKTEVKRTVITEHLIHFRGILNDFTA